MPNSYYEGALALGATHERSVFFTVVPAAKSGIMAGIILGVGRAIGETMAVIMIAGNQPRMPKGLFKGVRTLTSNIVIEMGYATDLHRDALIATAVVLFVFILLINLVMYTLSLLTIGLLCMIFKYPLLKNFSGISRIFICLGIVVLIFLALVFYMLLRKGSILYSICDSLIRLFEKIHIIRHGDRLRIKLKKYYERISGVFKQYHRADRASHRDFLLEYNAESFTAFGIVYDFYGSRRRCK